MTTKNCEHLFRLFKDNKQVGKGVLTFYCSKCLTLRKVKKQYEEDSKEKKKKK